MSRLLRLLLSVGAGGALVLIASPASAQGGNTTRPYRGLFASGTSDATHVLSVSGSAGAGYDTNVLSEDAGPGFAVVPAPPGPTSSVYSLASGALQYSLNAEGIGIGASLSSSVRRYSQLSNLVATGVAGSVGASFALTERTTFAASQAIYSQPALMALPFVPVGDVALGQATGVDQDFLAVRSTHRSYVTSGAITQQLSRRATISAGYSRHVSAFEIGGHGFESQSGSVRFSRGLTRDLGLRLGYGYTEARYGEGQRAYRGHTIDSGVDYSRTLSLTRRTRLAFSTGAAALNEEQGTRYNVAGNATLTREIGRTWNAALAYSRNLGFAESLRRPYFYDGVNGTLIGLLSRRLSFYAGAGATLGDFAVVPVDDVGAAGDGRDGFNSRYASSGLNVAISRHLAIGVNYTFYDYALPPAALILEGSPSQKRRHSVRASLNAWAPIFQRGRRANASR
jgi:hypothetical protein